MAKSDATAAAAVLDGLPQGAEMAAGKYKFRKESDGSWRVWSDQWQVWAATPFTTAEVVWRGPQIIDTVRLLRERNESPDA